jgi:hypothetical protein
VLIFGRGVGVADHLRSSSPLKSSRKVREQLFGIPMPEEWDQDTPLLAVVRVREK